MADLRTLLDSAAATPADALDPTTYRLHASEVGLVPHGLGTLQLPVVTRSGHACMCAWLGRTVLGGFACYMLQVSALVG